MGRDVLARYVWADLVRNPRRTLSTVMGVALGVGLSCAVLFFVDGLSASMTQRALAPLSIDMQRVVSDTVGPDFSLVQTVRPSGQLAAGAPVTVELELRNHGVVPANEVTVRSVPDGGLTYVSGSATIDGEAVGDAAQNPFAAGAVATGHNLGSVPPGATVTMQYRARAVTGVASTTEAVRSTVSSREATTPVPAGTSSDVALGALADEIAGIDGIAVAEQLSYVDLPPSALRTADTDVPMPTRLFGLSPSYLDGEASIDVVSGSFRDGQALLSVEAAEAADAGVGDRVRVALPDDTSLDVQVAGVVDLTRARPLFSSRRGVDLEAFVYVPTSVVLDAETFAERVLPAFTRAGAERGGGVVSRPVREVDVRVDRRLLDGDPGVALRRTEEIAAAVAAIGDPQDYVIDNVSNALAVADADAAVAKRMFVFLGLPGGLLAAVLAAYAGNVLASAQRREQATLRVRGASRRHLRGMLALRVAAISTAGSVLGVAVGYASARIVLGPEGLSRASAVSLVVSGVAGGVTGLVATGTALYVTGRRSIDREINQDRARLASTRPLWRRWHVDAVVAGCVAAATGLALATDAFAGSAGSVYAGRAVELSLPLLALPIGAWAAGSLLGARMARNVVAAPPDRRAGFRSPLWSLYRMSVGRRSWAIANGVIVVGLIVALGTTIAVFTASYDLAKQHDSRYVIGSDLRVTPRPGGEQPLTVADTPSLMRGGVDAATPVVFGVHNVILRSDRTSDVANLAAVDPRAYERVAPLDDGSFLDASSAEEALGQIADDPSKILLDVTMAGFLRADRGDVVHVLLDRGTPRQTEISAEVGGRFERLAGFPDGAHALIDMRRVTEALPSRNPDFFLLHTRDRATATLHRDVARLRSTPGQLAALRIDTRETALATDQSSLAAQNIRGLVTLDSGYGLAMGVVAVAIFVFGLLLERRREYVTLRAQGLPPRTIRLLIMAESGTVAALGCAIGVVVGAVMAAYFVAVLRPLFILRPPLAVSPRVVLVVVATVLVAATITAAVGSSIVNRLRATELLRDE